MEYVQAPRARVHLEGADDGSPCKCIEATEMSSFVLPATKRLIKRGAIQIGLEAVALPGIGQVFHSNAGRGIIFTLHHVRPQRKIDYEPNAVLSITPRFLEMAIDAATECGLVPVPLSDLPRLLSETADTRRFVCFTLDDGYRDNVEFAAPIFRKYRVPYTIFVTSGFVHRTQTMWWETAEVLTREVPSFKLDLGSRTETLRCETRRQKFEAFHRLTTIVHTFNEDDAVASIDLAARANGIDPVSIVDHLILDSKELRELSKDPLAQIGAHTVSHVNLRRVSTERLRFELLSSAGAIEECTGQYPEALAYPYGWFPAVSDRETQMARELGFSVAVTTWPGMLSTRSLETPTRLNRVSLNGYYQKKRYVKALITGIPFRVMWHLGDSSDLQ
jgi:peptidoglycan/xylan/chitin deacetylase (PgdA/CDA1 family)